jgi:DNA-binding LacI/PurR family transcriptional regulator
VFAANDISAIRTIEVAHELGLRVPEDVSVVGFDDITEAGYPHVALTTVHQDADRLGAEAVRSLADRLDGESPTTPTPGRTVIEPELVVRASTAPPAGSARPTSSAASS